MRNSIDYLENKIQFSKIIFKMRLFLCFKSRFYDLSFCIILIRRIFIYIYKIDSEYEEDMI